MDITCPHCHSTDRFVTHAVVLENAEVELTDEGWDITSPSFDMDLTSPDQPITCEACGTTFTAREGGWDVEEPTRPMNAKLVAIHGRVSLILALAVRFEPKNSLRIQAMLATAGHGCPIADEPCGYPLLLVCLEPDRYAAYLDAYAADQADCDLGDAYRWLSEHFDEVPETGYLLDLPSQARHATDKPTTTFSMEYGDTMAMLLAHRVMGR